MDELIGTVFLVLFENVNKQKILYNFSHKTKFPNHVAKAKKEKRMVVAHYGWDKLYLKKPPCHIIYTLE